MRRNVGLFITKREVKVSGFFAYSWMETETRSSRLRPLTHKNRTRLYYFEREHYFHLLSGQRAGKIAPARSQSHCRIPFVSSAHGASHLIMSSKDWALNRLKWRARVWTRYSDSRTETKTFRNYWKVILINEIVSRRIPSRPSSLAHKLVMFMLKVPITPKYFVCLNLYTCSKCTAPF